MSDAGGPVDRMPQVFVLLVGGLFAYELVALAQHRKGDTISEIMWNTTAHRPLVPFALGVLMGHLFWQRIDSTSGT